ncbi:MAG: hypothetical protein J6U01_11905, partial [Clostridia bacterium]|nr:hypothetical protein [Clostridia bacterium]
MAWEFEDLFDISAEKSGSLLDGEWMDGYWRDLPTEIRVGRMGYRTRTIKAGPRLEVEVFPIFGREAAGKARAAKKNLTPEAVQRNNEERSKRKLIQLIDANFDERDIHLTLTYLGTPPKYEQAQADVKNFLRAVKRKREKREMEPLKYIYTIEGNDDGTRERIHVHMVMNGGIDREELEAIWGKGYANADHLQPNENGLEALARYITKQQKNRRKWARSRNLKKPKQRTSDTKVSNARVKRLAVDFPNSAKEIMEKLYPEYIHVKTIMRYSDVVDGAYIRCVMRRKPKG